MSKFWILTKEVYMQKLRSKSFIFTTILYLLIITVTIFWSDIASLFSNDERTEISIVNSTSIDSSSIFTSNDGLLFSFPNESEEDLYKQLEEGKLDAVVEISEEQESLKANIVTYTPLTLNDQSALSSMIDDAAKIYGIQKLQLSVEEAENLLNSQAIITTTNLNEEKLGKSEIEKESGKWISYLSGIFIYFFITTFLTMITTEIASEKGSRALEMILVSVKPKIHFQSKIVGIMLLALSQFAIMIITGFTLINFSNNNVKEIVQTIMNEITYSYLLFVIIFVFLTLILFLMIGALFGSLVSKPEEASQVLTPTMIMMLIGFYVMISGVFNPDTLLITIFSYIPLTSGMVMPMRIGATDISLFEPIISLLILLGTVMLIYWLSIYFYKRSVLTYSSGGMIQKIKSVLKLSN